MAYTYLRVRADGVTREFSIPFDVPAGTGVEVKATGPIGPWSVQRGHVVFTVAPPVGTVLTISRRTPNQLPHEFYRGAAFTAANLDADLKHILNVAMEAREAASGFVVGDWLDKDTADGLYAPAGLDSRVTQQGLRIASVEGTVSGLGQGITELSSRVTGASNVASSASAVANSARDSAQQATQLVSGLTSRVQALEARPNTGGGGAPAQPDAVRWDVPWPSGGTIASHGKVTVRGSELEFDATKTAFRGRPSVNTYQDPGDNPPQTDVALLGDLSTLAKASAVESAAERTHQLEQWRAVAEPRIGRIAGEAYTAWIQSSSLVGRMGDAETKLRSVSTEIADLSKKVENVTTPPGSTPPASERDYINFVEVVPKAGYAEYTEKTAGNKFVPTRPPVVTSQSSSVRAITDTDELASPNPDLSITYSSVSSKKLTDAFWVLPTASVSPREVWERDSFWGAYATSGGVWSEGIPGSAGLILNLRASAVDAMRYAEWLQLAVVEPSVQSVKTWGSTGWMPFTTEGEVSPLYNALLLTRSAQMYHVLGLYQSSDWASTRSGFRVLLMTAGDTTRGTVVNYSASEVHLNIRGTNLMHSSGRWRRREVRKMTVLCHADGVAKGVLNTSQSVWITPKGTANRVAIPPRSITTISI